MWVAESSLVSISAHSCSAACAHHWYLPVHLNFLFLKKYQLYQIRAYPKDLILTITSFKALSPNRVPLKLASIYTLQPVILCKCNLFQYIWELRTLNSSQKLEEIFPCKEVNIHSTGQRKCPEKLEKCFWNKKGKRTLLFFMGSL